MAEESTTPDLVELTRQSAEALDRGDLDATMSCYAPDVVFDRAEVGSTFEGLEAIRGFFEDWRGSFDEISADFEEVLGFGHGVVLTVWSEQGRPRGSDGRVEQRRAMVTTWVGGRIQQLKAYADPDEARAAAERVAQERADG
jgi:ketosteroid isomerase-like protein